MSRFEFKIATAADDLALRQRMSQDAMQGHISVSFRREPSYFMGSHVQGEYPQIIKCVDEKAGKLVGLGARLSQSVFINGQPHRIGYLSDLRIAPEYRGSFLLNRGYQYLRRLHQAEPLPMYLSVILEGNERALDSITTGRAAMPIYKNIGRVMTPAIHLDRKRKLFKVAGLDIQRANKQSLDSIFSFIRKEYSLKQYSPVYQASDIGSSRLMGLDENDIYVARRHGKIVGVIAAWDQGSFRQTHVEKYSSWLKLIRPSYNFAARFTSLKRLPDTGEVVPYFYLALMAIQGDDSSIFRALLSQLYTDRHQSKWHYFIAGMHEKHPLMTVLNEYRSIKASGHLFAVYYPEDHRFCDRVDDRIPHIEIGAI